MSHDKCLISEIHKQLEAAESLLRRVESGIETDNVETMRFVSVLLAKINISLCQLTPVACGPDFSKSVTYTLITRLTAAIARKDRIIQTINVISWANIRRA